VLASDANKEIGPIVQKQYPQVLCYTAGYVHGWGAGLYTLLVESIEYLQKIKAYYKHLLSIDYDTVPIRKGADRKILDLVSPGVGLVGGKRSSDHWTRMIERSKGQFQKWGFPVGEVSQKSSILGALMLLTRPCINAMAAMGFFGEPVRSPKRYCNIADDAWLSFLVQVAGYSLKDIGNLGHVVWSSPIPSAEALQKGYYWYHPVKTRSSGGVRATARNEVEARNTFRLARRRPPLPIRQQMSRAIPKLQHKLFSVKKRPAMLRRR